MLSQIGDLKLTRSTRQVYDNLAKQLGESHSTANYKMILKGMVALSATDSLLACETFTHILTFIETNPSIASMAIPQLGNLFQNQFPLASLCLHYLNVIASYEITNQTLSNAILTCKSKLIRMHPKLPIPQPILSPSTQQIHPNTLICMGRFCQAHPELIETMRMHWVHTTHSKDPQMICANIQSQSLAILSAIHASPDSTILKAIQEMIRWLTITCSNQFEIDIFNKETPPFITSAVQLELVLTCIVAMRRVMYCLTTQWAHCFNMMTTLVTKPHIEPIIACKVIKSLGKLPFFLETSDARMSMILQVLKKALKSSNERISSSATQALIYIMRCHQHKALEQSIAPIVESLFAKRLMLDPDVILHYFPAYYTYALMNPLPLPLYLKQANTLTTISGSPPSSDIQESVNKHLTLFLKRHHVNQEAIWSQHPIYTEEVLQCIIDLIRNPNLFASDEYCTLVMKLIQSDQACATHHVNRLKRISIESAIQLTSSISHVEMKTITALLSMPSMLGNANTRHLIPCQQPMTVSKKAPSLIPMPHLTSQSPPKHVAPHINYPKRSYDCCTS